MASKIPSEPSITDLPALVAALPAQQQERFRRIYDVAIHEGELKIPPQLEPWVVKQFGSLEAITCQKIVRLLNRVTLEEVFINEVRSSRPQDSQEGPTLAEEMERAQQNDIFAHPEQTTSEDIFGRVRGKHCITASNVTKTDAYHGVVIFNDYNPLDFTAEKIADYIDTARAWAQKINELRPQAKYFLFFWNCLWRAGATQTHGHAQVMLGTGRHYIRVEELRREALEYRQACGANYFEDLYEVHNALGCACERNGTRILSYLTPIKFYEVMLLSERLDDAFKGNIYRLLAFFRDELKVTTFNLGLITPPLSPTPETWNGFPCIVRIIDRGPFEMRFADVGSFELFGATLGTSDPLKQARLIKRAC